MYNRISGKSRLDIKHDNHRADNNIIIIGAYQLSRGK